MTTTTRHRVHFSDAASLPDVDDGAVDLVVTSPPYPMIAMWDAILADGDAEVAAALESGDGERAFEAMHRGLDTVWAACKRVLCPGGLLCINVGDATRKIADEFRLYPNHARILEAARRLGFSVLPDILWRKPNNSPNKFLGSGMLPGGAYVTYEHEYVLILRNGPPRPFRTAAEKRRRRESAFFQEERNTWFSDLWSDLPGTPQALGDRALRSRSAAFPFELPWRLIQMYSLIGDTVLDPFLGTGTTAVAAAASGRSSIGYERDAGLLDTIRAAMAKAPALGRERARRRLDEHEDFIRRREARGKHAAHRNEPYGIAVVTSQERELRFAAAAAIAEGGPGEWAVETESVEGSVRGTEVTGESGEGA